VLAAIFIYLSIDESAGLHETLMTPLAQFHFTGLLRFSWIVPYGLGCIALGLIYIPFVFALPGRFRSLVIFAGALFLAAALGVESIGGYCVTGCDIAHARSCRHTQSIGT
jgi:hypothetical protein